MRELRIIGAAIAILLVVLVPRSSLSEHVSACGRVGRFADCLYFDRFDSGESYVLPDTVDLVYPGEYHITGESYVGPPRCSVVRNVAHLRGVVAAPCHPETLGCGRILPSSERNDCYVWASLSTEAHFGLSALNGFVVGDTALATGFPCPSCPLVPESCAGYGGLLLHAHLSACSDSVAILPSIPRSGTGTMGRP